MMRIGIMGAMPEEINGIRDDRRFTNFILFKTIGGKEYYRHSDPQTGHELYLVFSGWGKVAASSVATTLINEFKVETVIFTGVAGAVDESLKIGDVVLANNLVQHDMDCSPLGFIKRFEIPLMGKQLFETDDGYRKIAERAINETLVSHEFNALTDRLAFHRGAVGIGKPALQIKIGGMATGDQFIASKPLALRLVKDVKDATGAEIMCVDMESAAVGQVCFNYQIPLTVIRVMSDEANGHAPLNFPAFTKELAAPFNQLIIRFLLKLMMT